MVHMQYTSWQCLLQLVNVLVHVHPPWSAVARQGQVVCKSSGIGTVPQHLCYNAEGAGLQVAWDRVVLLAYLRRVSV